jgi:hypothetical protein
MIELPMPMAMYMHTNCLLFASCNKLLNNSTFYHLKLYSQFIYLILLGFFAFWSSYPKTNFIKNLIKSLKFLKILPKLNQMLLLKFYQNRRNFTKSNFIKSKIFHQIWSHSWPGELCGCYQIYIFYQNAAEVLSPPQRFQRLPASTQRFDTVSAIKAPCKVHWNLCGGERRKYMSMYPALWG